MTLLTHVLVTYPGGTRRIYSLVEYCLLPTAAVLGTRASWIDRLEALRLLAEERAA